jgi:hypothetical protein
LKILSIATGKFIQIIATPADRLKKAIKADGRDHLTHTLTPLIGQNPIVAMLIAANSANHPAVIK